MLSLETRRMAIANGTCVSFCSQPKAQFGYLTRVTLVCCCLPPLGGGIWLCQDSRESKAHLASPEYAPGTIVVNVTWMKRGFNACQTHCSMYPSIFNRFPVIQPLSSKVHHFSNFLHILVSPGYAPWTIVVNVTRLERGFNACKTPPCIYPSIFNHF